ADRLRRTRRSFGYLRLIPAYVERNRDYQVCAAAYGLAVLVGLALQGAYHPHIAVIVAVEFALGIRTFKRGREQSGGTESTDEVLVVIAEGCIEFFHRPFDIDWAKVHVVRRVGLIVGAAMIGNGLELLIALRMWTTAQTRQGRFRRDLEVVYLVIDSQCARGH